MPAPYPVAQSLENCTARGIFGCQTAKPLTCLPRCAAAGAMASLHWRRELPLPLAPSLINVYSSFATFILDCPSLPHSHSESMWEMNCRGSFIFQTPCGMEFNSPLATTKQQQTQQQQSASLQNKQTSFRKLLGVCSADSSHSGPACGSGQAAAGEERCFPLL